MSSVENVQWSIDSQTLSWSPPTFYSTDIPQGVDPDYNILINGISSINTTDTSVWLNVSSCAFNFNVSIMTCIDQYKSVKEYSVDNTGSKLCKL